MVGNPPTDWEVVSIGSVAVFSSGKGISVASLRDETADSPVPVYGGNGISGYTSLSLSSEPTIVVGRVGQKCGEVYITAGPAWITDNALYPRSILRRLDLRFFALALEAVGLNRVKNRNDLPLLTQSILHEVNICVPSTEAEQRAISNAMSDVDALLDGLDRLIAKKRDLKQAAMQELLTGRTRLPGYHGEWDISTVDAEFEIQLGKMLDAERNAGALKPFIGNRAVQWDRIDVSDLQTVPMSRVDIERYRLRAGDLLVCEGGEIGRAAIWEAPVEECYFQKALHRLRPRRGFSARLMAAFLRLWADRGLLANCATQTSIAHLPREKFLEIPLPVPSANEQAAIATVLSDMDAELSSLEARRDKTLALKQAMMQELLTGRTRLV